MKLGQLQHFLAVVEHGGFHRASDALHISQQALSSSIGKLEESLGAPLFDRGPNGVVLAASGARLVHRAKLICSEARRAMEEVREVEAANSGTVRIGVGAFFADRLVPVFLANYLRSFPDLKVTLIEGPSPDLFLALTHGELDFSLSTPAAGLEIPYELEHDVLFTMPTTVHMRVDHPLARESRLDMEQLVDCSWVVAPVHADTWSAAFSSAGLPAPLRLIKTDSLPAIRYFVAEGDYLMLGLDPPPGLGLFAAGRVVSREAPGLTRASPAVLVWRRSSPLMPSAGRMMEHVRDTYRSLGAARPMGHANYRSAI